MGFSALWRLLYQYRWWLATVVVVIVLTGAISAEFRWDPVSEDPNGYIRDWAKDWIPGLPALATFVVAFGVWQQLAAMQRGQRIEYAPVIRCDLNIESDAQKLSHDIVQGRYFEPIDDPQLEWHRVGPRSPSEEYLELHIRNLQLHASGSAHRVEIQVVLSIPTTPLQEYVFSYPVGHLGPAADEYHSLIRVDGLYWSRAEISSLQFNDETGLRHSTAHGIIELVRDRKGKIEPHYIALGGRESDAKA